MHRLFTAIKIKPGKKLVEAIDDFASELQEEKIKWVNKNNIHITLKFFGDTPESKIDTITELLQQASRESDPFELSIKGCGTFGSPRFPRIIWVGLEKNEQMHNLYENINKKLAKEGYEPEKRGFSPHLTIGRVKNIKNLYKIDELISKYNDTSFMTQNVKEFHLFESILNKEGPTYNILKTFTLSNK